MSRPLYSIPEPSVEDPALQEFLDQVRSILLEMSDTRAAKRFVSVEDLEKAGIARMIDGKLVKM